MRVELFFQCLNKVSAVSFLLYGFQTGPAAFVKYLVLACQLCVSICYDRYTLQML